MWRYVEADFRRDYGIRLCEELPHMSWREFEVLLQGLSPWGAVASHYEEEAKKQRAKQEDNADKPTRAVAAFWAGVTGFRPQGG